MLTRVYDKTFNHPSQCRPNTGTNPPKNRFSHTISRNTPTATDLVENYPLFASEHIEDNKHRDNIRQRIYGSMKCTNLVSVDRRTDKNKYINIVVENNAKTSPSRVTAAPTPAKVLKEPAPTMTIPTEAADNYSENDE